MLPPPSPPTPAPLPAGDGATVSPLRFLAVALQYRYLMLRGGVLLAVLAAGLLLVPHRSYTTIASFMPQPRRVSASNVAGLAAQFGLSLPTSDPASSPAFYVSLIQSYAILGPMVDSSYRFRDDTGMVVRRLEEVYDVSASTEARRRADTIKRMRKDIIASADLKSGLLSVRVRAKYPDLAFVMSQRLLQLLNRFNLETRQSQAAAERRFTQGRLEEIKRDLRSAEDALQDFLTRNRDYKNSPVLTFQEDRLSREVTRQQQLYSTLSQAYEQAKIEEVRDTPVFTLVDQPELPARPDPRFLVLKLPLAMIVGAGLGLAIGLFREFGHAARRRRDPDFLVLSDAARDAGQELRRPGSLVRGLLGSKRPTG